MVELEREREKGRRVEEDKASLKRKLDRVAPLRASSGGTVNIVEEELRGLKVTKRGGGRGRRGGGGRGGGDGEDRFIFTNTCAAKTDVFGVQRPTEVHGDCEVLPRILPRMRADQLTNS